MYYVKEWDTGRIVYEFEKLPIARRHARGMGHTGEDHPFLTGYPPIAHVVNEKGECIYNPRFSKQISPALAGVVNANDDCLRV